MKMRFSAREKKSEEVVLFSYFVALGTMLNIFTTEKGRKLGDFVAK
jgi:altronate dehydratase